MGSSIKEEFSVKDGQIDFQDFKETLNNFEVDAVDYLYDLEPQSQNLFWAGHFTQGGDLKSFYNSQFRIRDVSFPGMDMTMHTDSLTRLPVFDSAEFNYEVTINWIEDAYHSVQKYHEDWQRRWYDRVYDVLRCGISGKFRKVDIVAYHYRNDSSSSSLIENPVVEPLFAYTIGGMVPIRVNGMKFDSSNGQNDSWYSVDYKFSKLDLRFSNEIGCGSDVDIYTTANSAVNIPSTNKAWQPSGISGLEAGQTNSFDLEKLRIARSSSTHYDSMPV